MQYVMYTYRNISDAQNYRPVEDAFRTHLAERKHARRILEQVKRTRSCEFTNCTLWPSVGYIEWIGIWMQYMSVICLGV